MKKNNTQQRNNNTTNSNRIVRIQTYVRFVYVFFCFGFFFLNLFRNCCWGFFRLFFSFRSMKQSTIYVYGEIILKKSEYDKKNKLFLLSLFQVYAHKMFSISFFFHLFAVVFFAVVCIETSAERTNDFRYFFLILLLLSLFFFSSFQK